MYDYVKLSLRKRFDQLKIYVGINSLKDNVSLIICIEEIMDFVKLVKKFVLDIDVVIFSLLVCFDILLQNFYFR